MVVILSVAITVVPAAVIGTFVLDLGQRPGESAPSASLDVRADTNSDVIAVSHRGGDGLDAARTRVTITNGSTGDSATYRSAPNSDGSIDGGNVSFEPVSGAEDPSEWGGPGSGSGFGGGVNPGTQYTVELFDTQSQRCIYGTTITT